MPSRSMSASTMPKCSLSSICLRLMPSVVRWPVNCWPFLPRAINMSPASVLKSPFTATSFPTPPSVPLKSMSPSLTTSCGSSEWLFRAESTVCNPTVLACSFSMFPFQRGLACQSLIEPSARRARLPSAVFTSSCDTRRLVLVPEKVDRSESVLLLSFREGMKDANSERVT